MKKIKIKSFNYTFISDNKHLFAVTSKVNYAVTRYLLDIEEKGLFLYFNPSNNNNFYKDEIEINDEYHLVIETECDVI